MTRHRDSDAVENRHKIPGTASRRTVLGAMAAAGLLAGTSTSVTADEHDDNDDDETTIVLGGKVEYWFGLAPEEIEGEENPTIELVDGEDYEIVWINMDGESHDIAIQDEDEADLEEVDEEVDGVGETQTLEFTADEEMDTYYCTIHPETQIGDLEIVENDEDDD